MEIRGILGLHVCTRFGFFCSLLVSAFFARCRSGQFPAVHSQPITISHQARSGTNRTLFGYVCPEVITVSISYSISKERLRQMAQQFHKATGQPVSQGNIEAIIYICTYLKKKKNQVKLIDREFYS